MNSKSRASFEVMIERAFPDLHKTSIEISRELGHELIACGTDAGVAVRNVRKTCVTIFRKLNAQSASCDARQNLQHFNEPSFRLVTRDVPNRCSSFVRRQENTIAFGHAGS